MRILNTVDAVREAHELILEESKNNIIIGEGVPDPKCCFGTTRGLAVKFPNQVFDSPISENGVTGISIGASLGGIKPIFIHMRQDFLLYAMDQIVNNAAKWHSMFGGHGGSVPIVIKAFTGRHWGSGHQHSQNLESIFAHIPGLRVLIPYSPQTAKGLLIAAAHSPDPCIILEDRWIHHLEGEVPGGVYETDIHNPEELRKGKDGIAVCWGQLVSEAMIAAEILSKEHGFEMGIVALPALSPWTARATAKLLQYRRNVKIFQNSWWSGCWAHSLAYQFHNDTISVSAHDWFYPSSTPAINKNFYVDHNCIIEDFLRLERGSRDRRSPHDVPDKSFTGPF